MQHVEDGWPGRPLGQLDAQGKSRQARRLYSVSHMREQPVLVDNKGGGNDIIAAEAVVDDGFPFGGSRTNDCNPLWVLRFTCRLLAIDNLSATRRFAVMVSTPGRNSRRKGIAGLATLDVEA